jgi:sec-independent protein translocase protein TatA
MGTFSVWHWLIVLAVVLILFGGGGKIPKLMKDMGSGINAFKRGLKDEEKKGDSEAEGGDPKAIEGETAAARSSTSESGAESQDKDRKAANG